MCSTRSKKYLTILFANLFLFATSLTTWAGEVDSEVNADHNYTINLENTLAEAYVLDVINQHQTHRCFENFVPSTHFDINHGQATLGLKVREYKMNYCNTTKQLDIKLTPKTGGASYNITFEKKSGSGPVLKSDSSHIGIQGLNVEIK